MGDSVKITYEGKLEVSDLTDTIALFNEIIIKDQFRLAEIGKSAMTFFNHGWLDFLTRDEAIERFNNTPLLRAQVAAKNADSIAYSAIYVARKL